jgi:Glycosyltransferase family 87
VKAAVCLVLLGLDIFWIEHTPGWIRGVGWLSLLGAAWLLFLLSLLFLRRVPRQAATALIVLGGVGLPLAAGFAPPRSSDDLYRYVWDGRVQAHGIDPYEYAPADEALDPLRDDFLWPQSSSWCVPSGCTLINRPTVHTIYPPVAQAYFIALHYVSPKGSRERPAQLGATLFAVATMVLLLWALPRSGLDPRLAAVWAWCPLVALEAGNNAHVDVVAAFVTAAALVVLARARGTGRTVLGGALLGLAVAVKLTPALVVPSALRRRPLAVASAAALATVAVYLPHVLAVGPRVLGYLPGYLAEEGYTNGNRFALLTYFLPKARAPIAAVVILAGTAVWAWARSDPDRPWRTAVVTVGVALLVATSGYAWYGLLLVVLVAFTARYEWLAVALAGYVAQYAHELHLSGGDAQFYGYGVAAVVVAAVTAYREFTWRKNTSPTALPDG